MCRTGEDETRVSIRLTSQSPARVKGWDGVWNQWNADQEYYKRLWDRKGLAKEVEEKEQEEDEFRP